MRQHAARGGVAESDRTSGRVEQDRVDGLGPEARDLQHLGAQRSERRAPHPVEAAAEALAEPRREAPYAPRREALRSSGADDGGRDLGRRPSARPALRAEAAEHRDVKPQQARLHPIARRAGNPAPRAEAR